MTEADDYLRRIASGIVRGTGPESASPADLGEVARRSEALGSAPTSKAPRVPDERLHRIVRNAQLIAGDDAVALTGLAVVLDLLDARAALKRIAYEPLGPDDASATTVLHLCEGIARTALGESFPTQADPSRPEDAFRDHSQPQDQSDHCPTCGAPPLQCSPECDDRTRHDEESTR